MPVSIKVTLGAAATQISPLNINIQSLLVQNNAAHDCRVGDSSVTGTVATSPGTYIAHSATAPGGSLSLPLNFPRGTILSQWYIGGTAADVIDVTYEP